MYEYRILFPKGWEPILIGVTSDFVHVEHTLVGAAVIAVDVNVGGFAQRRGGEHDYRRCRVVVHVSVSRRQDDGVLAVADGIERDGERSSHGVVLRHRLVNHARGVGGLGLGYFNLVHDTMAVLVICHQNRKCQESN